MDEDEKLLVRVILTILVGVSAAVFVVGICCITAGWCNPQRRVNHSPRRVKVFVSKLIEKRVPSHKYQKGTVGLSGKDGTCAVCLSEFEEGEDLRTLPECKHSFHVPCIDMWLYSHANCPMCRKPQIFRHLQNYESGAPETQHESDVLPALDIVVQSRPV